MTAAPDLRTRVLSALGWAAVGRFAGQTVNWAITLVVIRILTPADYGLMAMAMIVVSALTLVADGMASGVIQTDEIDDLLLRKSFGLLICVSVGGAGSLALAAPLVAHGFAEPQVEPLMRVLALQFLVFALAAVPDALLVRRLDFKRRSAVEVSSLILGGLLALTLALTGHGVWSLVWGQLLAACVRSAGLAAAARFFLTPSFNFGGMRGVGSFSSLVTAGRMTWFLSDKVDVLIIGRLLGAHMLGFYVVALHLAALPQNKIQGILNDVAFSAFSSIKQEQEASASYLSRAVGLIAVVSAPVFLGVSALAPELVPILMGPRWSMSIMPLSILSLAIPLRMVEHVIDIYLQASGRAATHVGNMLFGLAITAGAVLIGAQWGLVQASVAWAAATAILFLFVLARAVRVTAISVSAILRPLARALTAGAVMYGAVALARHMLPAGLNPFADAAVLVATGVAVYSAAIWMIARSDVLELLALARVRGRA